MADDLQNIQDPDTGEIGSVASSELPSLLQKGYRIPEASEVQDYLHNQKYGSVPQQILTGIEGAGVGATFGATTGAEQIGSMLGVPGLSDEDINARRETNPISHGVGEGVGVAATSLLGTGEGALLEQAGAAGERALGLGTETLGARMGSKAVNDAIQFGLMQAGDETSKMLTSDDPSASVGSALLNIGLSSALGGAFGAGFGTMSPLWKSVSEGKLGQTLKMITDKAGGAEAISDPISQALDQSEIPISPEVKSALSNDPLLRDSANILRQSDTTASGMSYQTAEKAFRQGARDQLLNAVGKTTEDLASASDLSLSQAGEEIGKKAAEELQARAGPLGEQFEALREKFSPIDLKPDETVMDPMNPYASIEKPGTVSQIRSQIGALAQKEGWNTYTDSEIMQAVNQVQKNIGSQKTLGDLDRFITQVGNETYDPLNPSLSRAGSLMKGILKDAHSDLVLEKLGETEGPEAIAAQQQARQSWREASAIKEDLQDKLKIKSGDSIQSFIKALREESEENGEKIANRLSGKNNADTLQLLQNHFPETAELLKDFHQNQLLKNSVEKGLGGEYEINSGKLLRNVSKMSPELKQFALGQASVEKISAIDTLLNQLKDPTFNFSNTGRTWFNLAQHMPAGVGAMAAMLFGHNPVMGYALGELGQHLGKNIPDAIRLALLKFMGSAKPIEAEGFKTAADFIAHMMAGESALVKGAGTVFKAGAEVIPQMTLPSSDEKKKLEKQIDQLQKKPESMMNLGGKLGYYLEPHSSAFAEQTSSAFQYLQQLKPNPQKALPLDKTPSIPASQKASYDRALQIALSPLSILKNVKEGTVTPTDLQHFNALHPALYPNLGQKLVNAMSDHLSEEKTIPYATRLGLSLFLHEPMDSTMTPESIQMTQASFQQNASPTQPMPGARGGRAHSMKALGKIAEIDQTPSYQRELARSTKA